MIFPLCVYVLSLFAKGHPYFMYAPQGVLIFSAFHCPAIYRLYIYVLCLEGPPLPHSCSIRCPHARPQVSSPYLPLPGDASPLHLRTFPARKGLSLSYLCSIRYHYARPQVSSLCLPLPGDASPLPLCTSSVGQVYFLTSRC